MDHIQDVYAKKPEMIEKIFDNLTKVNLKVDGKPFQVLYNEDTDELEYHGRSGNETNVGPMIDDMYRLFSKPINDAIRHIEERKEVFKKYKFLTFEVISEVLLLTAIITKDGEFIDDPDKIDNIAEELETDVMPCLWKGKISAEQKQTIMEAISTNVIPTKDEFVKWVKALFGTYEKFPKTLISRSSEYIEGIVFFYNVDDKVVEYKLVDPAFRQSVKDNQSNMKADNELNAEKYKNIYEIFVDWAKDNASKLDNSRMKSIELNFIEMMEDPKRYNKLMSLATGLTTITTDAYFLQTDRISDELKKAIQKHGKVYQLLYEKFVRLFWKAKKRNFTISKEFQQDVNKICKMVGESLEDNEELIVEKKQQKIYSEEEIDDKDFDAFKTFVSNVDKNDKKILAPYILKWIKSSSSITTQDLPIRQNELNAILNEISSKAHEQIIQMINTKTYINFFDKDLFNLTDDVQNIDLCVKLQQALHNKNYDHISIEDINKIFHISFSGIGKGELLFKLLCDDITSDDKGDLKYVDGTTSFAIEVKCKGCLSNQNNTESIKTLITNAFIECASKFNLNSTNFVTLDFSENGYKKLNKYWNDLMDLIKDNPKENESFENSKIKCIEIFKKHLQNSYRIKNDGPKIDLTNKDNFDLAKFLACASIKYYAYTDGFKYLLLLSDNDGTSHKIFATLINAANINFELLYNSTLPLSFSFSQSTTRNGGGIQVTRIQNKKTEK